MVSPRRYFDVWSRFYGRTPFLTGALRRLQRAAVRGLRLPAGSRVLDLGCGPGDGLSDLRARGLRGVGGDFSSGMVALARRHGDVVRLSALALPFPSGTFDGLMCTNAFHHCPQPQQALEEMRRVLRPGGRLSLIDPSGDSWGARLVVYGGERFAFGMDDVHLHGRREWRGMLARTGFGEVRLCRAGALDPVARRSLRVEATAC